MSRFYRGFGGPEVFRRPGAARLALLYLVVLVSACGSGEPAVSTWENEPAGAFAAAISPGGRYGIVGSVGGAIRVFDITQQTLLHTWTHQNTAHAGIIAAAFSPDADYAITAERASLALWSIPQGELIGYWAFPSINTVALAKNGQFAMVGFDSNEAGLFDPRRGKFFEKFDHDDRVTTVALSADGRLAISGSDDKTAKLWDTASGELLKTIEHDYKVAQVAVSDDGRYVLSNAAGGEARVTDIGTLSELSVLEDRRMTLSVAVFSRDNSVLLTGRPSGHIDLWDVASGKRVKHWKPARKQFWRPDEPAILATAFSTDDLQVISQSADGYLQIWNLR